MSEDNKSTTSFGIGTILFLIFLTLKLAGIGQVATWSWWWVTSPIWIPVALILIIALVVVIVNAIDN
jgi:hypothetical protein